MGLVIIDEVTHPDDTTKFVQTSPGGWGEVRAVVAYMDVSEVVAPGACNL